MDLFKEDPKRMATLIFNGRRELDEVPMRQRAAVAVCIEELKRKVDAKPEPLEHSTLNFEVNTKAQITEKLDALGINYTKSAKKEDLFALLPV